MVRGMAGALTELPGPVCTGWWLSPARSGDMAAALTFPTHSQGLLSVVCTQLPVPREGIPGVERPPTSSEAEQTPTRDPAGPRPSAAAHPMARYLFPRLVTGSALLLRAGTFLRGSFLGPALSLGGTTSRCGWLVPVLSRPLSTL